jgi:hypothetical protein
MAMPDRATAITVKTALVYRSVVMETPLLNGNFIQQYDYYDES